MLQYISKAALAAELKKRIEETKGMQPKFDQFWAGQISAFKGVLKILDTLEATTQSSNINEALEKFKTLQHITGDMKATVQDWGYAPNLYQFDGSWHVDWISCEEGDSLIGFSAETPEEAINKACEWFHSTFCNS